MIKLFMHLAVLLSLIPMAVFGIAGVDFLLLGSPLGNALGKLFVLVCLGIGAAQTFLMINISYREVKK